MPVLKVKQNGAWEDIMGGNSGGQTNGGDADTLDGKHANEFAFASDVEALNIKIGDSSVSEQITNAIQNYLLLTGGTISGPLTLNGNIILSSSSYGTTLPDAGTTGRIFFKRA